MEYAPVERLSHSAQENAEKLILSETGVSTKLPEKIDKSAIRTSLKASTGDGVFASIFTNITSGVLLSNFLLQLGANPMEIGMLASVPMLVNLLQPVGAYFSERTTSRRWYNLCIFGTARLLWLILVLGIAWNSWHQIEPHALVSLTLAIILATNLIGALGTASWMSWMATLVPVRLRGRYFGIRNSVASLTNLVCIPLLGLTISAWPRGGTEGYGVVLLLGVAIGLISLGCQFLMADVNPQQQGKAKEDDANFPSSFPRLDPNFLKFLLYFSFWAFAVNISAPFYILYMLDNLNIDVSWVTLYGSFRAATTLVMMVVWGKLADRIGNRPIMLFVGVLLALLPLLWIVTGSDSFLRWVWLPFLHLLLGILWAAMDLCNNNLQMAIAPQRHQASYFAIAAAANGLAGAMGTTAGGFLVQFSEFGSLSALFALSAILRLIALLPLLFVTEPHRQSLVAAMRSLFAVRSQPVPVPATVKAPALTTPHL